ncbi:hypothetical protein GH714_013842 [Hevea brasiliensis]|uniref:H15 domain-containing protein n=1 Tax=Hevea brasiliensis TaxID=3981 RepID=A0A6A6LGD7_HEVBR|nr:hypothetical protein GH714_013842 [Hevea brasiliensis]
MERPFSCRVMLKDRTLTLFDDLAAIAALDERNGSNKTPISKYIESKYRDLPAGHTTLLSHHLNRMKSTVVSPARTSRPPKDPNAPPKPVKPKPSPTGSGKPREVGLDGTVHGGNEWDYSPLYHNRGTAGSGRPRGRRPKVKPASVTKVSVQNEATFLQSRW